MTPDEKNRLTATKKTVKNNGAVPQYYVEDCHEAIIDPATFDRVILLLRLRLQRPVEITGRSSAVRQESGTGDERAFVTQE